LNDKYLIEYSTRLKYLWMEHNTRDNRTSEGIALFMLF
jgi:hypothetical protein